MSCMTHTCCSCGLSVFNNKVKCAEPCPNCTCGEFISDWDELDIESVYDCEEEGEDE